MYEQRATSAYPCTTCMPEDSSILTPAMQACNLPRQQPLLGQQYTKTLPTHGAALWVLLGGAVGCARQTMLRVAAAAARP